MNRGFGFYYKEAIKSSATTIWKNKNFFKVIAFWFMELIGRLCLLGPVFDLAGVRQAKLARKYRQASIPENFKIACRANSVWTMVFAIVLEALMTLAGVVMIALAGGLFIGLGILIGTYAAPHAVEIFMIVFAVPVAIVLLTYLFIMTILFSPTAYIVASNKGIGAAAAVSACLRTMRERGKATVFTTCFVTALINGGIVGLMFLIRALLNIVLARFEYAGIVSLFVTIVFVGGFFTTVPMFSLARRIALNALFEDISLDSVNELKNKSGINIKKYSGMSYDSDGISKALPELFETTESDSIPLPDSDLRQKNRDDAMRADRAYRRAQEEKAAQNAAPPQTEKPERETPQTSFETPAPETPVEEYGQTASESAVNTDGGTEQNAATEEAPTDFVGQEAPQSAEGTEERRGEAFGEPNESTQEQAAEHEEESGTADEEFVFSSSDSESDTPSDGWPTDSEE